MSLSVFSLFPYSKKGDANSVDTVKKIVSSVKACRIGFLDTYFKDRLSAENRNELSAFIPPNATLIPLPKSAPLVEKALWPGKDICEFLIKNGFGKSYFPIIKRIRSVPKAAFQDNSVDRPSVQTHYDSILLEPNPLFKQTIQEIVLVDDVVTQGRTSYACYLKIKEQFDVSVKLFSLIRTDSFAKITTWNMPAQTEIKYYPQSGKTFHNISSVEPLGGLWSF